jgi:flagellin
MGLRINQNIAAQNAYRNLSVTDSQMSKSLEKLSSGFRINRAADDAAGLSISEGLRSQIGGLKVAVRNTQDGVSVAQTAEGSLNEVTSILQRMRDLSVQASNEGSMDTAAAKAVNLEMEALNKELNRIGDTTAFGKSKLLDGSFGATHRTTDAASVAESDMLTAVKTDGLSIQLDKVAGKALVDSNGDPIEVTIAAADLADATNAQDVADLANKAITAALKNAQTLDANGDPVSAGLQGDELKMTARTDAGGNTKMSLTGTGEFAVVAGSAGAAAADMGLSLTTEEFPGGNSGKFQVGANRAETISISIGAVDSETLGTANLSLSTGTKASEAIDVIDKALAKVSDSRSQLGAVQNRFEHTVNNLNVAVENLSASESRIRDTDMAKEMTTQSRNSILAQAGTAMLAQANQASQGVLKLLQ